MTLYIYTPQSGVRTPPGFPKILLKTKGGGGSYPEMAKSAGALKIRGVLTPKSSHDVNVPGKFSRRASRAANEGGVHPEMVKSENLVS